MQFDRTEALATIEKVEKKKLRLGDPAFVASGLSTLRNAIEACATDEITDLAKLTDRDASGAADYALVSVVPLEKPAGPPTQKQGGLFAGRQFIEGDLFVGGALAVTGHMLVTGSLKANAVNVSATGSLVVGGSLSARVLSGDGWLWVRGDVHVDLALGYDKPGELRIGKALKATLGIMSNHRCVAGERDVKNWFDLGEKTKPESADYRALESSLDEHAITPEDKKPELGLYRIDFRALTRLAALGQPMFRASGKAKAAPPPKPSPVAPVPVPVKKQAGTAKSKAAVKAAKPKPAAKPPVKSATTKSATTKKAPKSKASKPAPKKSKPASKKKR